MIIKNLKDKNGLPTDKKFSDIFNITVVKSTDDANILNINSNEIKFNLKNIDLYGTNYGIPIPTRMDDKSYISDVLAPLTIA